MAYKLTNIVNISIRSSIAIKKLPNQSIIQNTNLTCTCTHVPTHNIFLYVMFFVPSEILHYNVGTSPLSMKGCKFGPILDRHMAIEPWSLEFSACHTDYTIYTCCRAFSSGTWNVTTGVRTPTSLMQALYTNVANQFLSSIRIKKQHYFKWSTRIKIWTNNKMHEAFAK